MVRNIVSPLFFCLAVFTSLTAEPASLQWKKVPFLWGKALDGFPITQKKIQLLAAETEFTPNIIAFYLSWPAPKQPFSSPQSSFDAIRQSGAIACLTWEPFHLEKDTPVSIPAERILEGAYDSYLNFMAEEVRAFGSPLFIRLAHEMNLEQYHWGTSKQAYGPENSKLYKQMFRYVYNFFKQKGVRNAIWVFCPNAESIPQKPWNRLAHYYPGDAYVDVFGIDGYSWSDEQPRSFKEIFKEPVEELRALHPNKPIFVFETSAAGTQAQKRQWIEQALTVARGWEIAGIVWFQVDKEKDWKLHASTKNTELLHTVSLARRWIAKHVYTETVSKFGF